MKEPENLRVEMNEFKANIFREKDGELAAVDHLHLDG